VRFKPVTGTVGQAGCVAVRFTTYDDDYVGRSQRAHQGIRAASPSDGHQPSKADHFLQGAIHG